MINEDSPPKGDSLARLGRKLFVPPEGDVTMKSSTGDMGKLFGVSPEFQNRRSAEPAVKDTATVDLVANLQELLKRLTEAPEGNVTFKSSNEDLAELFGSRGHSR